MKLKVTSKTLKTLLRIVICLALVLSSVLSPLATYNAYAAEQNNLGVKWTRVKSIDEMKKACDIDNYQEYDPNTVNFWKPVIIAYQSGNNYYYITNSSSGHEWEEARTTRVTKTSGIKIGDDTFTTRNKANAPMVKFHNSSGSEIMIRNQNSKGEPSNFWLNVNIEWWGIRWHAVHHVNINGEGSPYDGFEYWSASSHDTDPWFDLCSGDDGKFRIRWISGHSGCTDRTWEFSGSTIEYCVGNSYKYQFYIYIGEPTGINYLETHLDLDTYQSQCMQDYTIPSNVEITVPEGATLIMMGQNHNNGHILVNGGTLVIRGSLDADYGGTDGERNGATFHPSDIDIINGGKLIIERDGSLLHRNKTSSVKFDNYSSAYIQGTMIVANIVYIGEGCSVEALPGSFIGVGIRPDSDHDYEELIPSALKTNQGTYLESVISWDTNFSLNTLFTFNPIDLGMTKLEAGLNLGNGSSFVSYGAVFLYKDAKLNKSNGCYMDARISKNHYATIGSMMRQWE